MIDVDDIDEIISRCYVNWLPGSITPDNTDLPQYHALFACSNGGSKDHAYFRWMGSSEQIELKSTPTVVDLFCGMGAGSRGFSDAGMRIIAGVDNDWYACGSFKINHPSSMFYREDVSSFFGTSRIRHYIFPN